MIQLSEDTLEDQIQEYQRSVFYDTREYNVGTVVRKYSLGLNVGTNEFFIPEYRRGLVWDKVCQSRFIESLMMGIPIPYILIVEAPRGRYEVVDGSQRIRTLSAYLNNNLKIEGLEKLSQLNGTLFSDLYLSRQRRFKNISLVAVVLSRSTPRETIDDIFERMNTGNNLLKHKNNSIVEKDDIE